MHFSVPIALAALVGSAAATYTPYDDEYEETGYDHSETYPSSSSEISYHSSSSDVYPHPPASETKPHPTYHPTEPANPTFYPTNTYGPPPPKETLTTYTTVTTCPVTYTKSAASSVYLSTTLTTKTITVTSCIAGCAHYTPAPTHGGEVTSTHVSFVPCSTPVTTIDGRVYYSTYLTPTYFTTVYPAEPTPGPNYEPEHPGHDKHYPADNCPAPTTVYSTIYHTETVTVKEGGGKHTYTEKPHKPTKHPQPPYPTGTESPEPPYPTGSGAPKPPHDNGAPKPHGSGAPKPPQGTATPSDSYDDDYAAPEDESYYTDSSDPSDSSYPSDPSDPSDSDY